ncbi:8-amino-7-oxononanoate synthase [Mucilaginibacter sp. PAMB04168]|uniref:aminotransferase class I/II-fold pyridoxal phosphate-dependent enzyme n=1 Tax=Mucilaginibacter sp. PAMB04168 TaxID=3138567 RepID=UPI0031F6538C
MADRALADSLRQLRLPSDAIDFYSNDYLGFARSKELTELIEDEVSRHLPVLNGSTGSRLLAGNTAYAENLENTIAHYHKAEAALFFNSGYDANLGILSSLPQRGDTVIHDELAHASIIDGIRLSHANRYSFNHNNLEGLAGKLKSAKGICYVVVESVYSMDGDLAPLADIVTLCKAHNASLIVDEAHALGVFDKGLVNQMNLQDDVFARVVTFGKALGTHGAVVLGTSVLRNYLINFARSFIYTTAAPFHQLASVKAGYKLLEGSQKTIAQLKQNISTYAEMMVEAGYVSNTSAIQTVKVGGNEMTKAFADKLQKAGLDVRPILSPTVPAGTERLRICLHAFNKTDEIEQLVASIKTLR